LGGKKGIQPVKKLSGGMPAWLCLGQGADLHMAQLMPLPHNSLAPVNADWFYFSGASSPG